MCWLALQPALHAHMHLGKPAGKPHKILRVKSSIFALVYVPHRQPRMQQLLLLYPQHDDINCIYHKLPAAASPRRPKEGTLPTEEGRASPNGVAGSDSCMSRPLKTCVIRIRTSVIMMNAHLQKQLLHSWIIAQKQASGDELVRS